MERTKLNLPDVINHSVLKNYTAVPNELINDPDISSNAFKIYCILISNPKGWKSHKENLYSRVSCGYTAIQHSLVELEQRGLLLRVQVRHKRTKRRAGSFLSVTNVPGHFFMEDMIERLERSGFELYYKTYNIETHIIGSGLLNNTISKKTIEKTTSGGTQLNGHITKSMFDKFWSIYPRKVDKGKAQTFWFRLCQKKPEDRPSWRQIKTAVLRQKKSERWQDKKFIPHPSTWLNQSRWLDDPTEMKSYNRESTPTMGTHAHTEDRHSFKHADIEL